MSNLTKLENNVLQMLLVGDDEVLVNLRSQLETVSVKERKANSAGFYTMFKSSKSYPDTKINGVSDFSFGDVHADIEGLNFGAGFLLYIERGEINMLEAYSYDEPWPTEIGIFELTYINGQRDYEKLRSIWSLHRGT